MYAQIALPIPLNQNFTYRIPDSLEGKVQPGSRVIVPFGPQNMRGYAVEIIEKSAFDNPKQVIGVVDELNPVNGNLLRLGQWISDNYICSLGEALDCIFPVSLNPKPLREQNPGSPQTISMELDKNRGGVLVLNNTPLPGRINIYLDTIEQAVKNGQCIVLVPEINYIDNIWAGIIQRFSNTAAVWHSKLSDAEKYNIWFAAKKGQIKIVIGTRSAVFTPFENLKCIIIDEEPDQSYKNPQKPFYDTIEVAKQYRSFTGSMLMLGGEIVSVNTYYHVKNKEYKQIKTSTLKLPEIQILEKKRWQLLGQSTISQINQRLMKNELSFLSANRRGFAKTVICLDCKSIFKCPKCKIALGYHSDSTLLKCHYCSYTEKNPTTCPECRKKRLKFIGVGTQQIEAFLKNSLPHARIVRADHDSMKDGSFNENELINNLKTGAIDVIIGTRIIIPLLEKIRAVRKISLVIACDIDGLLSIPDYKAGERAFTHLYKLSSLLNEKGLFIMETNSKKYNIFKSLKNLDWKKFYREEISLREELLYPPAGVLLSIVVRGRVKPVVDAETTRFNDYLNNSIDETVQALGPEEPFHSRLRGQYRQRILIKCSHEQYPKLAGILKTFRFKSGVHSAFDVNPWEII